MKTVLTWFHGDKGGVGKSFIANSYADMIKYKKNKNIVIIDADIRNPDVNRMWKNHAKTYQVNLNIDDGWKSLASAINDNQGSEFIISLPSQIGEPIKRFLPAFISRMSRHIDIESNMIFVISISLESVALANYALDELGEYFNKFDVVLNGEFGQPEDFIAWNKSKIKNKIMNERGGLEIYVEPMSTNTVAKIMHTVQGANTAEPFTIRVNNKGNPEVELTFGDLLYIEGYLNDFDEAFSVRNAL